MEPMKFAVIDPGSGVVENVIIATAGFVIDGKSLVASETAGIGDIYDYATGEFTRPAPPEAVPPTIVVFPVDLWSRMTDVEADQVEAAMSSQSVRIQNIFKSASSYRSDHELWPLLNSVAHDLFGATRAGEILAPS